MPWRGSFKIFVVTEYHTCIISLCDRNALTGFDYYFISFFTEYHITLTLLPTMYVCRYYCRLVGQPPYHYLLITASWTVYPILKNKHHFLDTFVTMTHPIFIILCVSEYSTVFLSLSLSLSLHDLLFIFTYPQHPTIYISISSISFITTATIVLCVIRVILHLLKDATKINHIGLSVVAIYFF